MYKRIYKAFIVITLIAFVLLTCHDYKIVENINKRKLCIKQIKCCDNAKNKDCNDKLKYSDVLKQIYNSPSFDVMDTSINLKSDDLYSFNITLKYKESLEALKGDKYVKKLLSSKEECKINNINFSNGEVIMNIEFVISSKR